MWLSRHPRRSRASTIGPSSGASIDAVKASDACKKALKDSRQLISDATDADAKQAARDGLKRTLSGSWPNYKNYSFVTQNGVPLLVQGDKC